MLRYALAIGGSMKKEEILKILAHTKGNEIDILRSKKCGCAFCSSIFDAREVKDWVNENEATSARCPRCGSPYVIGDAAMEGLDKKTLSPIVKYLRNSLPQGTRDAEAERFCASYLRHEITPSEEADNLFFEYATSLFKNTGNIEYIPSLIRITASGTEFHQPNVPLALSLAMEKEFDLVPEILCLRASLLVMVEDELAPSSKRRKAFEWARKACELGNLLGRCILSDFYMAGIGVKQDFDYGFSLLESELPMAISEFFWGNGENPNDYCHFFIRLSSCYLIDEGSHRADPRSAVRYALLAKYALGKNYEDLISSGDQLAVHVKDTLASAAEMFGVKSDEMILDENTMFDTFVDFSYNIGPLYIHFGDYDPIGKTLSCQIAEGLMIPFIDCSSLRIETIDGPHSFTLNNVASYDFDPSFSFFQYIEFRDNEWVFLVGSPQGNAEIGRIVFQKDKDGDEE